MPIRCLSLLPLILLLSACASSGGGRPPLSLPPPVATSDLAGDWYVIANIPYFAERGRVAGRVTYRARADGRFDDLYHSRKGGFDAPERTLNGIAWSLDPPQNRLWRSRFYWPLWFDFQILHLDPVAGHLLLAHPSRDYAWVMAREPELPEADYATLLQRFQTEGYDVTRLLKVPQRADQVGQAGFQ